jgi:hypothetical protein
LVNDGVRYAEVWSRGASPLTLVKGGQAKPLGALQDIQLLDYPPKIKSNVIGHKHMVSRC